MTAIPYPRSSGFDLKLWKLRRACFTADIEDRITPAPTGPLAAGSYGAVRKLDGWNHVANRAPGPGGCILAVLPKRAKSGGDASTGSSVRNGFTRIDYTIAPFHNVASSSKLL
jgi:hypothetical protein